MATGWSFDLGRRAVVCTLQESSRGGQLVWRKGLDVKYETANVRMNVISSSVLATIVPVEKQCVAYCECVFIALVTPHAMRMRCIALLSLAIWL
jgi:hypothetical protein